MDSNGDRETDFSLWDMHPETGTFRVRVCPQKTVPYRQEGRLALPPSPRASVGSVVTPPCLLAFGEPWVEETQLGSGGAAGMIGTHKHYPWGTAALRRGHSPNFRKSHIS